MGRNCPECGKGFADGEFPKALDHLQSHVESRFKNREDQIAGLEADIELRDDEISDLKAEIAARDAKIAELEKNKGTLDFLYTDAQKVMDRQSDIIDDLEARIAVKDAALQMAGQFINPIHTGNLHIRDMVIKTIHEALTSSPSDLVERLKRVEDIIRDQNINLCHFCGRQRYEGHVAGCRVSEALTGSEEKANG